MSVKQCVTPVHLTTTISHETFGPGAFEHITHLSDISFPFIEDAFLYSDMNPPPDTRAINLFAISYVVLTHSHLLCESHLTDRHGK